MRKLLCCLLVLIVLSAYFSLPFGAAGTENAALDTVRESAKAELAATGKVYEGTADGDKTVFLYTKIEDTDQLIEIVGVRNCPEVLVIPEKINGYTVRKLGKYAFAKQTNLREVTLPGTLGKEAGIEIFGDCTNLTTVTFSEGITWVSDSAFARCTSLKNVYLPDSLKSIHTDAFLSCTSLETLRIPASVSYISDTAFVHCRSMKNYIVDPENQSFYVRDGMLLSKTLIIHSGTLYHYTDELIAFPEGRGRSFSVPDYVKGIGQAFWYNDTIEEISFSAASGDFSFKNCVNLKKVEIRPSEDDFTLSYEAFSHCTSIEEIILPENTVVIGANAFNSCTGLKKIRIPDSVTTIGSQAFYRCCSLKHMVIGNGTKIVGEKAFKECTGLRSVVFGDSVDSIKTSAFEDCTSLDTVVFNEGLSVIGLDAFLGCESLHKVYVPKSVEGIQYTQHPALGFYDGGYSGFKKYSDFTIYSYYGSKTFTYAMNRKVSFIIVSIPDELRYESERCMMKVGDSVRPTLIVAPDQLSTYPIMYTSDNNDVAEVAPDGTVTAISSGRAVITAHAPEGIKATLTVTVEDAFEPTEKPTEKPTEMPTVAPTEKPTENQLTLTIDHHPDKEKVMVGDELLYGCFLNAAKAYRDGDQQKGVINAVSGYVLFDQTKLELISDIENTESCFPVTGSKTYAKINQYGLWFSAFDEDGFTFADDDSLLVKLRFKVIGAGESEIEALPYNVYCYSTADEPSYLVNEYHYMRKDVTNYYNVFMTGYSLRLPLGDVDGDRKVTAADVTFIQRFAVEADLPENLYRKPGDIDKDGFITIMDATLVQRWLAGIKTDERIGIPY